MGRAAGHYQGGSVFVKGIDFTKSKARGNSPTSHCGKPPAGRTVRGLFSKAIARKVVPAAPSRAHLLRGGNVPQSLPGVAAYNLLANEVFEEDDIGKVRSVWMMRNNGSTLTRAFRPCESDARSQTGRSAVVAFNNSANCRQSADPPIFQAATSCGNMTYDSGPIPDANLPVAYDDTGNPNQLVMPASSCVNMMYDPGLKPSK